MKLAFHIICNCEFSIFGPQIINNSREIVDVHSLVSSPNNRANKAQYTRPKSLFLEAPDVSHVKYTTLNPTTMRASITYTRTAINTVSK